MEEFDHDEKAFAQSSGPVAASGVEPQGYPVERICPPAGHNVPGPLGPPPRSALQLTHAGPMAAPLSGKTGCRIHYQVVCFCIKNTSADTYYTYGLQCLCKLSGQWIQLDMIQDISLCGDDVFSLASRFNTLQLSPLHFRDAVLDSVS